MTDSLDFPEDPECLAAWLDQWIGDLDNLPEVVITLVKRAGRMPRDRSAKQVLRSILGPSDLRAVGERGLTALADRPALLRWLIEEPGSLLELQEWIFTVGAPYWGTVSSTTPAMRARIRRSLTVGMSRLKQVMKEGPPDRRAPQDVAGVDSEKPSIPPQDAS